jgi:hypothetical protein
MGARGGKFAGYVCSVIAESPPRSSESKIGVLLITALILGKLCSLPSTAIIPGAVKWP